MLLTGSIRAVDVVACETGFGDFIRRIQHVVGVLCLRDLVSSHRSVVQLRDEFGPIRVIDWNRFPVGANAAWLEEQLRRFGESQRCVFHCLPAAKHTREEIGGFVRRGGW